MSGVSLCSRGWALTVTHEDAIITLFYNDLRYKHRVTGLSLI
jgi:hypothetical protein